MKLFIIILAALSLFIGCRPYQHSSDAELEQKFVSGKADFAKLAQMLNEDSQIVRMDNEDVFYSADSKVKVSQERLLQYRILLKKLDLFSGIHRDNMSSVRLIASKTRFPFDDSEKSFLFSIENVAPIVESLDEIIRNNGGDQKPIYKKIDSNWYLVYENW